jgi:hypothetical protein
VLEFLVRAGFQALGLAGYDDRDLKLGVGCG